MAKMKKKKKMSSLAASKPYVIYKLRCNDKKSILISKCASLVDNDEKMSKIITLIKNNGDKFYGAKFRVNPRTGKLVYRSKDGLYGVWKSNLNKCLYLLLYVDYRDINKSLKKMGD